MRGLKNSVSSRTSNAVAFSAVALLLAVAGIAAYVWCASRGFTLYYGDAEAHFNIARRVIDSRSPGPEQLGTVWLPLPHLLLIPFAAKDSWWWSGAGAAIPSVACAVLAGIFFFASCRKIFGAATPAAVALAVFALNPNILYLQSTSMTEPVFAAALAVLLWATIAYRDRPSVEILLVAGAALIAATLTRYEGWFLVPFVCAYVFMQSPNRWNAVVFSALAILGPAAWLAHNGFYYSNPLEFYNGDYSAMAIYQRQLARGITRYPGDHNLQDALRYYFTGIRFAVGWAGVALGAAGLALAAWKRMWWPTLLLLLAPIFYVWSIYSSGTPFYVPTLWPNAWYNTRYALAALPLIAFGCASLTAALRSGWKGCLLAAVIIASALATAWAGTPITWKESEANSVSRRKWTREAAEFLALHYRPNTGIIYSFGDLTGVLREARIPLREGLHEGNRPNWDAAVQRPDLFLREGWALAMSGDKVSTAILRANRRGPHYSLRKQIIVEGAPVIEIYERELTATQ